MSLIQKGVAPVFAFLITMILVCSSSQLYTRQMARHFPSLWRYDSSAPDTEDEQNMAILDEVRQTEDSDLSFDKNGVSKRFLGIEIPDYMASRSHGLSKIDRLKQQMKVFG